MRGKILYHVLQSLREVASDNIDLFDVFLKAGHGASYGKINDLLIQKQKKKIHDLQLRESNARVRQRYMNLLSYLRRHQLIKEEMHKNGKLVRITPTGLRKLSFLEERLKRALPNAIYRAQAGNKFVIVMFDIPEKEKWKREWLRKTLHAMGLKLIQKSVWIGKIQLPKEFLNDLRKYRLVEYIEIFEAMWSEHIKA